jgi:hypothetical protein
MRRLLLAVASFAAIVGFILCFAGRGMAEPVGGERAAAITPTGDTLELRRMFSAADGEHKRITPKFVNDPLTGRKTAVAYQVNDTIHITANGATFAVEGTVSIDWKGPADRPAFLVHGCTYTVVGGPGFIRVNCRSDKPLHSGLVMQNRSLAEQERDKRACSGNSFVRIQIAESDLGGLLFDGFRVEGGTADRKTDRNNDLHRFVECLSIGAGHAGFHIPDGNTQAYQILLSECWFVSNGAKPEEFSPFGIKVVSGSVHVKGGGASRNQLDIFLVRNSRPMVVEDWMSENSERMFDTARLPAELFQRIDFVRCSWNSEHIPADREVFTYRQGGTAAVGFDCVFTHFPDRKPIVRMEKKGTVTVHPATNGEVVVGESPRPSPIHAKELLPF